MLSQLRDTVVVLKLDQLGRSLRDLIDLVADFKSRGVEFVSLQDGINTATPTGRFTFNIFASLAECNHRQATGTLYHCRAAVEWFFYQDCPPTGIQAKDKSIGRVLSMLFHSFKQILQSKAINHGRQHFLLPTYFLI